MNLITIVFLTILLFLSFLYLIKSQLLLLMSWSLKAGFIILVLINLSALFMPKIYKSFADFSLKKIGIHESIQNLDKNYVLNYIPQDASDFWQDVENFFSGKETKEDSNLMKENFFEDNIYEPLMNLISSIYRYTTLILTLVGIASIIYFSLTTTSSNDILKLKRDYKKLRNRIEELENKFKTP